MTTPEPLLWRKSTFSAGNGDCVEVAPTPSTVFVRDSKNVGPVLAIPTHHWRHFAICPVSVVEITSLV